MIAAARHAFTMASVGQDGVPFAEKLKHLGKRDKLKGPKMPRQAQHVWEWFLELAAARTGNGFGPNPISFSELKAWADLTGRNPKPLEIQWLKALDRLWLSINAKQRPADG